MGGEAINLVRESVHLTESGNFKNYGCAVATMSEQAEKPITFNMSFVCHVDISSKFTLTWVCFSCMNMNNYAHLYKRFSTFYRDSVLMKAPYIQQS